MDVTWICEECGEIKIARGIESEEEHERVLNLMRAIGEDDKAHCNECLGVDESYDLS